MTQTRVRLLSSNDTRSIIVRHDKVRHYCWTTDRRGFRKMWVMHAEVFGSDAGVWDNCVSTAREQLTFTNRAQLQVDAVGALSDTGRCDRHTVFMMAVDVFTVHPSEIPAQTFVFLLLRGLSVQRLRGK